MASTFTPSRLVNNAYAAASQQKLYTVPGSTSVTITAFTVNNTDSVNSHTVNIWLAPTGATGGTQALLITVTLAPGQSYSVYQAINQVLTAGSSIQASCDQDTTVSVFVSGIAIT